MFGKVTIMIIVSIILFIIIVAHFWFGSYYKNLKFKTLLTVITTFTSIMFSLAIIVQVLNYHTQKANEEINERILKMSINNFIHKILINYSYIFNYFPYYC
jgi:energy-coupling factor transporter transmembrane protein EcfT